MQITLHCGGGLDSVINTDQDEYTVNYRSAPNWDEYTVNYRSAPNWDEYSLYCMDQPQTRMNLHSMKYRAAPDWDRYSATVYGSAPDQDELTLYEV